jgi:hypothetical protein
MIKVDIYAKDSIEKVYDVEIQREDRGAGPQRARFNSSMIDTRMLKAGEDFSKLRELYVIFITENDVLNHGLALYHIDRRIDETNEFFGDGSHIIYVNGSYTNDDNPIGKLMHDFRCTSADNMYYPVLADRVRYFKENERGKESMCKMMEDMRNEAAKKAEDKRNETIALNLLEIGKMSIEEIASATGLTVDCVNKLAEGVTS